MWSVLVREKEKKFPFDDRLWYLVMSEVFGYDIVSLEKVKTEFLLM